MPEFNSPPTALYLLNTALLYCPSLAKRTGRAVAADSIQERKVRTLKGSEPANGGASDKSQISDLPSLLGKAAGISGLVPTVI